MVQDLVTVLFLLHEIWGQGQNMYQVEALKEHLPRAQSVAISN